MLGLSIGQAQSKCIERVTQRGTNFSDTAVIQNSDPREIDANTAPLNLIAVRHQAMPC